MISIAVIDDEADERKAARGYFAELSRELGVKLGVDEFSSGEDFLERFDCSYDIICLDIDMPGRSGIETAAAIREKDADVIIIFVTNMAQMAIRGYEVQALDFLVKPMSYYPFAMKLRRAVSIISGRRESSVILPTSGGMQKVSTGDICYVEVRGHYLFYRTAVGDFRQKASLKELEARLEGLPFCRCHQAFLVNLKYVTALSGDSVTVYGDTLHISRAKRAEFTSALTKYLGGAGL